MSPYDSVSKSRCSFGCCDTRKCYKKYQRKGGNEACFRRGRKAARQEGRRSIEHATSVLWFQSFPGSVHDLYDCPTCKDQGILSMGDYCDCPKGDVRRDIDAWADASLLFEGSHSNSLDFEEDDTVDEDSISDYRLAS